LSLPLAPEKLIESVSSITVVPLVVIVEPPLPTADPRSCLSLRPSIVTKFAIIQSNLLIATLLPLFTTTRYPAVVLWLPWRTCHDIGTHG